MARTKKKKQSASTFNPGAVGVMARSLVGEGMDAVWRIGTAFVVIALAIGWAMGRGPLRAQAAEGVDLVNVAFVSPEDTAPSAWGVPDEVVMALTQEAIEVLGHDPFDRTSLIRVSDTLRATGWFEELGEVRRTPDNTVRIDVRWRAPRAMVERRGERTLVGDDGAPMLEPRGLRLSGLVTVMNPLEAAPRRDGAIAYGTPWGLSDVTDAIALLDAMAERDLERYIAMIDVRDTSRIRITSTKGAQVLWGGSIGAPEPGEASAQERLNALGAVLGDPRWNQPMSWNVRFGDAERIELFGS